MFSTKSVHSVTVSVLLSKPSQKEGVGSAWCKDERLEKENEEAGTSEGGQGLAKGNER